MVTRNRSWFVLFVAITLSGTSLPAQETNKVEAREDAEDNGGQATDAGKESDAQVNPQTEEPSREAFIAAGIKRLLELQHKDGSWDYEGVYRVDRKIPVGYRIGGTAIVCEALLYGSTSKDELANQAMRRGIELVLKKLEHPLMVSSVVDEYDVRVWGHIYALDLFCRLKVAKRFPELEDSLDSWIKKLTVILLEEEIKGGGWNYANHRQHAAFVTAPAIQALLWARQLKVKVPRKVFTRATEAISISGSFESAFAYSGREMRGRRTKMPGSIARSANCESTLVMLGQLRLAKVESCLAAFHEHWDELEKRRKKTGTHEGEFGIAPYYFFYGHRYASQAIQLLPKHKRANAYDLMFEKFCRTRDEDGTWNDRVFEQSKSYGTAMTVLSLLEDKVPLPEKIVIGLDPK